MTVHLEWHSSLPLLQATYEGSLSANEYRAMCRRRLDLLNRGPEQCVLLANMQQMEGFPDSAGVDRRDNIFQDDRVFRTLVVIPEDLYSRLSRTVVSDTQLPVHFFPTIDRALDMAETLLPYIS